MKNKNNNSSAQSVLTLCTSPALFHDRHASTPYELLRVVLFDQSTGMMEVKYFSPASPQRLHYDCVDFLQGSTCCDEKILLLVKPATTDAEAVLLRVARHLFTTRTMNRHVERRAVAATRRVQRLFERDLPSFISHDELNEAARQWSSRHHPWRHANRPRRNLGKENQELLRRIATADTNLINCMKQIKALKNQNALLKKDLHNAHHALTESEAPFYKGMQILNKHA